MLLALCSVIPGCVVCRTAVSVVVSNHRIVVACCFLQNISHIFLKPRIAKLAPEGVDILRDVHYRYRRLEWTWHRFPKDAGAGLFLES